MQVPTDVTIDRVVPLRAAEGDTGPSLPIGSMLSSYFLYIFKISPAIYFISPAGTHDNVHEATSHVDSLVGVTDAYTTVTSPRQVAMAEMTRSEANVIAQTAKQVPDEVLIYHLSFTRTSSTLLHFRQCTYDNIFFLNVCTVGRNH